MKFEFGAQLILWLTVPIGYCIELSTMSAGNRFYDLLLEKNLPAVSSEQNWGLSFKRSKMFCLVTIVTPSSREEVLSLSISSMRYIDMLRARSNAFYVTALFSRSKVHSLH